jgi:hypothetical protein
MILVRINGVVLNFTQHSLIRLSKRVDTMVYTMIVTVMVYTMLFLWYIPSYIQY